MPLKSLKQSIETGLATPTESLRAILKLARTSRMAWVAACCSMSVGLVGCGGGGRSGGGGSTESPPTVASSQSLPVGTVATNYSATLAAAGGTPPYVWSVASGSLPAGLTLASATGVISGTDVSADGTFAFYVVAEDANHLSSSAAAQSISVSVATLAITGSLGSLTSGTPVDADFMVTPATTGPFSWSLASGALPSGVSLSGGTTSVVAISGTPTVAGQTYSFSLKVTDAETPTAGAGTSGMISGTVGANTASIPVIVKNQPLPTGTVGNAYSAVLAAAGGTLPYANWSMVSGSIPPGLSLDAASGVISGTDRTVNGPFVFSVQVQDANLNTSASSAQTIQVAPATLAIGGSLGTLTTNTAVNAVFTASPATVGPYAWSVASGSLPTGLALSSSTSNSVAITGTPTSGGQVFNFTLAVTDAETPTSGAGTSAAIVGTVAGATGNTACATRGQESLIANRSFAFLVNGFDGSGKPMLVAGSVTADGTGKINAAEMDYNGITVGPQHIGPAQLSGSYALGPDHRGCIGLTILGAAAGMPQSIVLYFSMNSAATGGRVIEFDDSSGTGNVASGILAAQTPAVFSAALGTSYAFGLSGWDSVGGQFAMAGSFSTGGVVQGATPIANGFADINSEGAATGELTGMTGSVTSVSAADGRATASLTIPDPNGGSYLFDFVIYVVNQSQWIVIGADALSASTPYLSSGHAIASNPNYGATPLNGAYLFAMQGYDFFAAGNDATIGVFQAAGTSTISNASFFENDAGNYHVVTTGTGTYTVDAINASSGRIDLSGIANSDVIVYLCNPLGSRQIVGFTIGTDSDGSLGELVLQGSAATNYSNASLNDGFTFGTIADEDNSNANFSGEFQFGGTGSYTFVNDVSVANSAGPPYLEQALSGTGDYSVNADGTGSINGSSFALVTNGQTTFAIPTAVDGLLYVIQQ